MPDPYQSLLTSAFRFMSVRSRSEKELVDFLQKKAQLKKFDVVFVEKVVLRMKELGYIDDKKFAESFLFSRSRGKPKGPQVIRQELKIKGISEELIAETFSKNGDMLNEEEQIELGKKALGKKGERYKKLPILECKRKVHDLLVRRGFTAGVTHRLVDDYCQKAYNKSQEFDL